MSRNGRANDFLQLWREGKEHDGIDYGALDPQQALEIIESIDTVFKDELIAKLDRLREKT